METESPSRPASYPEKLLALRRHLGLTQAELAKLLGTSIVSINRWEKGHSTPSAPSWQRVQKLMASLAAPPAPQPNNAPQAIDFAADPELVRTLVEGERLSYGHLFNAGFSAEISAIDPLPHQRIAVYDHMLAQSPLRFLLADDAGAGKTVMAGLYLREMLNRRRLRRILVVAPAGLTTNWRRELAQLFGLRFVIATGADAKANNPFIGPSSDQLIVSLDTLAADRMFSRLQEANVFPYDLVIMDEAHKLSARTENDGTVRRTDRYKLAEALAGVPVTESSEVANARWRLPWKPEHLLLLTATPHMGKDDPYFFLWRLLCPDLIPTLSAFQAFSQESRQRHFLRRTKEEMLHFDGRRLYPQRISDSFGFELSQSPVPAAQPWLGAGGSPRGAAALGPAPAINDAQRWLGAAGPQAGASTSGTRGAAALGPAPTDDAPSEQLLYDRTTEYLRTFYNLAQILNQAAARLATGVFQRRLASSTFALLRSLERRSDKLTALIRSVKAEGTRPLAQLRLQWGDLRNLLDDATADEEQPEAGAEESERAEIRILETVVPATLADLELELAQ
ncbi:MAG TPA: SNF2-related protein, partial [Terriglobales bacterium]|nr:SNF2-related protein [Terriglobales bacterium]